MQFVLTALLSLSLVSTAMGEEPPAKAPHRLDGSFVSVKVVGGMSPYQMASWEVIWRARVAVAGQYRSLVNYGDALLDMRLVTTEEYEGLLKAVEEAGGFALTTAPEPATRVGALVWEVEIRSGAKKAHWRVDAPDAQSDRRYEAVIGLVRDFVAAHTERLLFRNVFFDAGTFGYVNLTAVPPARIYVDGRDTHHTTPLYGYELPIGKHVVRLVAEKEGWEREHTLRVEPGMTTIVHFDLR